MGEPLGFVLRMTAGCRAVVFTEAGTRVLGRSSKATAACAGGLAGLALGRHAGDESQPVTREPIRRLGGYLLSGPFAPVGYDGVCTILHERPGRAGSRHGRGA